MPDKRRSIEASGTVMIHQVIRAEKGESSLGKLIVWTLYVLVAITFPFSCWYCWKVVKEYERAVIFRLGRLKKGGARGPGLQFVLPWVDEFRSVGLRTSCYDIKPQTVLTRDSVTVIVDGIMFYQVKNPLAAVCNVKNSWSALQMMAMTQLRNVLGTFTLAEMLTNREEIATRVARDVALATEQWGFQIQKVELKNILLPRDMQRVMAAEAEATRDARAKVIHGNGERLAARGLAEAAAIMDSSPQCLALRHLQTIASIATEKHSTILFPLPMSLGLPEVMEELEELEEKEEKEERGKEGIRRRILPELYMG